MAIPLLDALGRRIMICGPSNSGKSTLAVAIANKLSIEPIHLDQLHHLPDTYWVPRLVDDFTRLHDEAIAGEAWAMDGNYSRLFPQRLARATGIVLLGDNRWANFARYVRRTLFQRNRPGSLAGGKDRLSWNMARWILVTSPVNLRRYRADLPQAGLPFVECRSMNELQKLYAAWGLAR